MRNNKPMIVNFLLTNFTRKFWLRVTKGKDHECWPWNGACHYDKYTEAKPYVTYQRRQFTASRVAYFITYKVDPGSLLVCHTCDNPVCMNPAHLFLGTDQANSTDCVLKNRQYRPIGELNNRAETNRATVTEIRRLYATGHYKQTALGSMFHLSQPAISMIVNNKRW